MKGWKLYVGVDWATEKHDVCLVDRDGEILNEKIFENSGEGIEALYRWISEQHRNPSEIAVAIETPHGALVERMVAQGFAVFSLNPKQLDRFRDRHSPSGAKDDRLDAFVLGTSLRTDEKCFRRVNASSAWLTELQEWTRISRELKTERTRLSNQLRAQLERYHLAILKLGDPHENWLLALWEACPTPDLSRGMKRTQIAAILSQYRIRRYSAEEVLEVLHQQPLPASDGTVKAAVAHIGLLIPRLQLLNQQVKICDRELGNLLKRNEEAFDQGVLRNQRDIEIMLSVQGLGTNSIATLIAHGAALLRDRDYQGLRCLSGSAPVTKRTGTRRKPIVVIRRACSPELRNALYHWSRVSVQHDELSKVKYRALRARGVPYPQALRSIGDRNLKMLCAMLTNQTTFDPQARRKVRTLAA